MPFDTISFTSDFGLDDVFVGVCHGVLARTAPHARVIDLTHAVGPQDVIQGSVLLARAVMYLPVSVHLAVVDPGVGSERHGIAVATGRGDVLVGPDNGLLLPAAEALGGVSGAWVLANEEHRLHPTSRTFHGRDIFSPAAGAIASGLDPAEVGPATGDLREIFLPGPRRAGDGFEVPVLLVDRFGNLQLAADADLLGGPRLDVDGRVVPVVDTFADLEPGQLGAYRDSDGYVALAVNNGSAAETLGVGRGALITVRTVD